MTCGHTRKQFTLNADGGLMIDSAVDAVNQLRYSKAESPYENTVWGAKVHQDGSYGGVKRYYYGRIANYHFDPRYSKGDSYLRSLGYRANTNEQPVYAVHRLPYENPTEHPVTEQVKNDYDPLAGNLFAGIAYMAKSRNEQATNERALELLHRIAEERTQGVKVVEVINFNERARLLHERIRDERRLMDGELSEAA